jgi:acylphosphatase
MGFACARAADSWHDVDMAERRAINATVRGRVHGVGFRYSTVERAEALGVAGWVRNSVRGTVEVFAQGDPRAMESFIRYLRSGPPAARVDGVTILESTPDPALGDFTVRA